jgi:uncharacterized damage-inducible protein DinB
MDLTWQSGMTLSQKLTRYKAWSNKLGYEFVESLPAEEIARPRDTYFGSILRTLHHNFIVDEIFQCHLENRPHGYSARTMQDTPPFPELWEKVRVMDDWWIKLSDEFSATEPDELVSFKFIDGSDGLMTKLEIIMHLANHTSYHRGFVDDTVTSIPAEAPAVDFPVYLKTMYAET